MNGRAVLAVIALVVAGAGGYGIYRWLNPNVIHGVVVCGQVLDDGKPVANGKGDLCSWWGGQRYVLEENGSLTDGGREDRSRSLNPLTLDQDGRFCTGSIPLKYYYRLGQFVVDALQVKIGAQASAADRQRTPEPLAGGTEGWIVSAKMDQKAQDLRLEAVFELDHGKGPTLTPAPSKKLEALFRNAERMPAKKASQ